MGSLELYINVSANYTNEDWFLVFTKTSHWGDISQIDNGDIIKFCGDSMIVSWMSEKNSKSQEASVVSSLLCAVDILEEFQKYDVELPHKAQDTTTRYHTMSVHIGIGIGSIHHLFVGHQKRAEYLITGEAITKASRLLSMVT
jgi:class 3 adenylate cyclase